MKIRHGAFEKTDLAFKICLTLIEKVAQPRSSNQGKNRDHRDRNYETNNKEQ
jgi:hypothetical protein